MGLVDDHTAPLDGIELGTAAQDHLKRGDHSLELVGTSNHPTLKHMDGTCDASIRPTSEMANFLICCEVALRK